MSTGPARLGVRRMPLTTASHRLHAAEGWSGSNVLTAEVRAALLQDAAWALQRLEMTVCSELSLVSGHQRSLLRCSLGRPCQANTQTHLNLWLPHSFSPGMLAFGLGWS